MTSIKPEPCTVTRIKNPDGTTTTSIISNRVIEELKKLPPDHKWTLNATVETLPPSK